MGRGFFTLPLATVTHRTHFTRAASGNVPSASAALLPSCQRPNRCQQLPLSFRRGKGLFQSLTLQSDLLIAEAGSPELKTAPQQ